MADRPEPDAGAAPASVERRIVSVLFADLVGFTPLSERLDAEDVATIQDAYFAARARDDRPLRRARSRSSSATRRWRSSASRAARDDDAERAVRAGLALIGSVEQLGARLGLEPGELQLRVGVNSGEVVHATDGPDAGTRDRATPSTPPRGSRPPRAIRRRPARRADGARGRRRRSSSADAEPVESEGQGRARPRPRAPAASDPEPSRDAGDGRACARRSLGREVGARSPARSAGRSAPTGARSPSLVAPPRRRQEPPARPSLARWPRRRWRVLRARVRPQALPVRARRRAAPGRRRPEALAAAVVGRGRPPRAPWHRSRASRAARGRHPRADRTAPANPGSRSRGAVRSPGPRRSTRWPDAALGLDRRGRPLGGRRPARVPVCRRAAPRAHGRLIVATRARPSSIAADMDAARATASSCSRSRPPTPGAWSRRSSATRCRPTSCWRSRSARTAIHCSSRSCSAPGSASARWCARETDGRWPSPPRPSSLPSTVQAIYAAQLDDLPPPMP